MYILLWKKGTREFRYFHSICYNSYKYRSVSNFDICPIWGKIWPVVSLSGMFNLQHVGTVRTFPAAVAAAACPCAGEAASRVIRRGTRSRTKELRSQNYKYCTAAAPLLPQPSAYCYIACCKNVTSPHRTVLNHVEITKRTALLCFGLELMFGGFF